MAKRVFGISAANTEADSAVTSTTAPPPGTDGWLGRKSRRLRSGVPYPMAPGLRVDLMICDQCFFWATSVPIPGDLLSHLYVDYRQPSYDAERSLYEPEYPELAGVIGGEAEFSSRQAGMASFLADCQHYLGFRPERIRAALDWGGDRGQFLPDFQGAQRDVFDISGVASVDGVRAVLKPQRVGYDYIQIAHVLEHLSFPLQTMSSVLACLRPAGWLMIEVPLELDPRLLPDQVEGGFVLHEHIKKYTPRALSLLGDRLGLAPSFCQLGQIETPAYSCAVVRLLGQLRC
jgi:Methyltransferase domain